MRGTIASRMLRRLLALLALAGILELAALPEPASAGFGEDFTDGYEGDESDGPGTSWRKCRDEAWSDYNECLMEDPDDTGQQYLCYYAWDLDNTGCTARLLLDLTGIASIFK